MPKHLRLGLLAAALAGTVSACSQPQEWQKTPQGLEYSYVRDEADTKVKHGQVIVGNAKWWVMGDTTDINAQSPVGYFYAVYDSSLNNNPNLIQTAWQYMGTGDSIVLKIPVSNFYMRTFGRPLPDSIPVTEKVTFAVGVDSIWNQLEWQLFTVEARLKRMRQSEEAMQQLEKDGATIDNMLNADGKTFYTTPAGVRVVITEEGDGPELEPGNAAALHYEGRLFDGTLFDTSYPEVAQEEGIYNARRPYQPVITQIGLGNLILGWDTGLPGLKQGSKATLYIPSTLAYGKRGSSTIPPDANLKFDVELLRVVEHNTLLQNQELDAFAKMLLVDLEQPKLDAYFAANDITPTYATESGVQIVVHESGDGDTPQSGDMVRIDYVGRLLNGALFDTSKEDVARAEGAYQPGRPYQPLEFQVGQGQVIVGWDEALLTMPVGTKATLYIPSPLAYGSAAKGDVIKPNSILVFDVEMLGQPDAD